MNFHIIYHIISTEAVSDRFLQDVFFKIIIVNA